MYVLDHDEEMSLSFQLAKMLLDLTNEQTNVFAPSWTPGNSQYLTVNRCPRCIRE